MTVAMLPPRLTVRMAELPAKKKRWASKLERGLPLQENDSKTRLRRGHAAADYRESYANVWRRLEQGETPEVCGTCGAETDVQNPAHDNRCEERSEIDAD